VPLYIFDANVWIDLGRHNPPDIWVSLWKQIDAAIVAGTIRSPEEVLHEVAAGMDGLDGLLKKRAGLFVPLDDATMIAVGQVTDGCNGLIDPASDRNRADPFVVALAMVREGTVVTKERARKGSSGRPRIPDACAQFSVPCLHWFDFLRNIGWQL
jgi:hypothetical protein